MINRKGGKTVIPQTKSEPINIPRLPEQIKDYFPVGNPEDKLHRQYLSKYLESDELPRCEQFEKLREKINFLLFNVKPKNCQKNIPDGGLIFNLTTPKKP